MTLNSEPRPIREVDVLIVGSGPAGLTVATELARAGVRNVEVIERDEHPGGVPLLCPNPGFGLRTQRRFMTGPVFAEAMLRAVRSAGIPIRTGTSVLSVRGGSSDWTDAVQQRLRIKLVSKNGRETVLARTVVLATGARERTVVSRWIPGGYSPQSLTLGALQRLVAAGQPVWRPGARVAIVGAEHSSFAAAWMISAAQGRAVAMITDHGRHQTWSWWRWLTAIWHRFRVYTNAQIVGIDAAPNVRAVEFLQRGRVRSLPCDAVVVTGDWVPEAELAERAQLVFDEATAGPAVDQAARTSMAGVFAVGNVVHPGLGADRIVQLARKLAVDIAAYTRAGAVALRAPARLVPGEGIGWVWPQSIDMAVASRRDEVQLQIWPVQSGRWKRLEISQDGRVLHRTWFPELVAHRVQPALMGWSRQINPAGGPVQVRLHNRASAAPEAEAPDAAEATELAR